MLSSQRVFINAIKQYCQPREIAVEARSEGWLIVMTRGGTRRLAFGYDVGLNSAVAHQIANDKAATSEVLRSSDVPCIPHTLFLGPKLAAFAPDSASWGALFGLLDRHPHGLVVKPNAGTSGDCVVQVRTREQLKAAASRILSMYPSLAVSPFVDIADEVRVVLVDDRPTVIYGKRRPSVIGDGKHSLIELATAAAAPEQQARMLAHMSAEFDKSDLAAIVPSGERRLLDWRHNLDLGAEPVLLEEGETRDICVDLAIRAAQAVGIRFASVDVISAGGVWQVLEINAGVKMEALNRRYPELVYATYEAALDKVFG